MAGNIKGITIEFRGETTKLSSALKQVNRETRSIDQELKKVNTALRFNPTSVDLWRQKQTLLRSKISETQDKLKLLKDEQKRLDAKGVDKNSKEYRELQREIITTENKLKNFKRQLDRIGSAKLQALSAQFKAVGAKVTEIGKGLTTHVTGPLVALGAASIKSFQTVDQGLDTVVKKTGASGTALEKMKQSVKNLASTIPTDFNTAGEAIGQVNTRFGLTGKALESLSAKFIKFAALNDTNVSTSVDKTQKALAAFGLDASQAEPLLDQLNVTGQQTGVSMDVLLDGLVQNATAFQQLGLSAQQSAILMGQIETSGANSETVMQGLRKALKQATKDGIPLDQALKNLQSTIAGDTEGVDGLQAAYDLFGKSGDQIYQAVKSGTLDFSNLGIAASDAGGSIEKTFNETLSPTDKFTMAMNDLKTAGSELGAVLLETLEPIIKKMADGIQKLTAKWNTLSPGAQKAIVTAGLVVAALGPLLVIIGTLITSVGAIIGALAPLGAAFAILTGPIGIVIAIIAGLVAAMILLKNNWKSVEKAAQKLWKTIKKTWDSIKKHITKAWDGVKTKTIGVWQAIKTWLNNAWTAIKTKAKTAWDGVRDRVINPIKKAKEKVVEVIKGIRDKMRDIWISIRDKAKSYWDKVKEKIIDPIKNAKETVEGIIKKIDDLFPIDIGNIMKNIKLPHFKWEWEKVAGNIKLPKFKGVSWYANGGIFNAPTIAGLGEAGPEAVVPLDKFWAKLDKLQGNNMAITININGSNADPKEIANEVRRELIKEVNKRRLAWQ